MGTLLREPPAFGIAPVAVVEQGRVAVGDPIGHALGCRCVVVLFGERPRSSSPDSLGSYLTWDPRPGRNDARRNRVSNVRPERLTIEAAARCLRWLLDRARTLQRSGVEPGDGSKPAAAPLQAVDAAFLLAAPAPLSAGRNGPQGGAGSGWTGA